MSYRDFLAQAEHFDRTEQLIDPIEAWKVKKFASLKKTIARRCADRDDGRFGKNGTKVSAPQKALIVRGKKRHTANAMIRIERPDDCKRIRRAVELYGNRMHTLIECQAAWETYSQTLCQAWLRLPDTLAEIWQEVRDYI